MSTCKWDSVLLLHFGCSSNTMMISFSSKTKSVFVSIQCTISGLIYLILKEQNHMNVQIPCKLTGGQTLPSPGPGLL